MTDDRQNLVELISPFLSWELGLGLRMFSNQVPIPTATCLPRSNGLSPSTPSGLLPAKSSYS